MELTEQQKAFFEAAIVNENMQKFVTTFWLLYDIERESGRLPEIDPGNPHTSTLIFALAGYPLSCRDGLERMQEDLDGVIEELSRETINNPWL